MMIPRRAKGRRAPTRSTLVHSRTNVRRGDAGGPRGPSDRRGAAVAGGAAGGARADRAAARARASEAPADAALRHAPDELQPERAQGARRRLAGAADEPRGPVRGDESSRSRRVAVQGETR